MVLTVILACATQIKLGQLGNFFPRISKAVRAATLEKCNGDLEEAANELFGKMAELADADDEEDPEQEDDDDEDAEQTKYILKSTHEPSLVAGSSAESDDGVGEWTASNGKGKGRKKAAGSAEEGLAAVGDLALLYSRDEEVAAATGRAEACGHYEILKGAIDRTGMPAANTKVVHVVGSMLPPVCVRARALARVCILYCRRLCTLTGSGACGQERDGNCLFVAVSRMVGDKRLQQITTSSQV